MKNGMKYLCLIVRFLHEPKFVRLVFLGLFIFLFAGLFGGVSGEHNFAKAQLLSAPQQDSLLDMAQENGRVRVIVRLEPTAVAGSQSLDPAAALDSVQTAVLQELAHTQTTLTAAYQFIPYMALEVDGAALNRLAQLPWVSAIEADVPAAPSLSSTVPLIGADRAWQEGYTGKGQTVAILDTGVDNSHPAFTTGGNRIVSEACYSTNSDAYGSISLCPGQVEASTASGSADDCVAEAAGYSTAQNNCEHGTHVAGIAAGNDGDLAGVAKDANIIAIQIYSLFTSSTWCGYPNCVLSFTSDQISALERVYELRDQFDIAAVNMSLGGGRYTEICDSSEYARKAAIDKLREAGIATIISAGNNGYQDALSAPACISSAVSVGASDDQDNVASYSNRADFLDLFAPGTAVIAPIPGGGTGVKSGTSMAAPHVTGAWAIIKQAHPDASVDQVLDIMKRFGDQVSDNTDFAVTRLNVVDVVDANFNSQLSYYLYLPAITKN